MSILVKIEEKIHAVKRRFEAAQANLQRIADEKHELESAYRVLTQIIDEEGKTGSNGAGKGEELSQPKLVRKIVEESPRGLRPSEIRKIAEGEYGREIPPTSVNAALAYAKKSGAVKNKAGLWSANHNPKGKTVTANNASPPQTPPQSERPDPVERSEDDDSESLFVD